jgi:arylsulfatase
MVIQKSIKSTQHFGLIKTLTGSSFVVIYHHQSRLQEPSKQPNKTTALASAAAKEKIKKRQSIIMSVNRRPPVVLIPLAISIAISLFLVWGSLSQGANLLSDTASMGQNWIPSFQENATSGSLKALEDATASAATASLKALEDATSNLLTGLSSSSKVEETDMKIENRQTIQEVLVSNRSFWESFTRMTSVNGTILENFTGTKAMDMTQNVLRVQDFTKPAAVTAQPGGSTSQTASEVPRNLNNGDQPNAEKEKDEPLNMVLFYADDWTMKVLGVLNPHVETPNIDEMAGRGMLFTRNCVTTSICWISRATLATGVYAAVHNNLKISSDNMFNKTVPWLETLYPQLKANGYYTGLVGKWHAPSPPAFMKDTFDKINSYYGQHWMTRNGRRRHVTDLNGEDALQFLRERPKDKKFSLTVSFFATHAWDGNDPPYQPMTESFALYTNATVPRPKTATDEHWKQMPWFFEDRNMGRGRWRNRFDTNANYQDKIKNLYRMATEVDAVVGAVIDELKQQGVYDKTLLVFTTDNGNMHGEHGLAEKWYPFEESIRVPLVIQDPRMPESAKGTRNDDFTLSVDLAPTLLAAAGITPPKFMQGRDIAQLYLNPQETKQSWRQDFFYEWTQGNPVDAVGHPPYYQIPAVFALIRKDYKYFYWPQVRYEQLFRIETDPYEEADILNSTAQTTQQALQIMKARYLFMKTWAQSGNPV